MMIKVQLPVLLSLLAITADANDLGASVVKQSRRWLNLGSIFGSATHASPWERVAGHPVFQVTTPWGSPYLNMEKRTDAHEVMDPGDDTKKDKAFQDTYRQVALFFLDPDDALAVHCEMSQMEQMANADIRITSTSLARALRQSANLGNGLLTGYAPDSLTGRIKSPQEGGSLRYKIVPPKRQLYYAARCIGKERVGLFSETGAEDAEACVIGNSALEAMNLIRRRDKFDRKIPKKKTPMGIANAHMDGYVGLPVFYAPEMERKTPFLKKLISGAPRETPLFFDYEDLEDAWAIMRKRSGDKAPEKLSNVEVFNLWDVVTSMERDQLAKKESETLKDKALNAIKNRFVTPQEAPGLGSITFVPSSRSIRYKNGITRRGNGKARLPRMRAW